MHVDDATVAAAKDGDHDAWRELYRAHAGRLLVWLESRHTGLGEAPDDVAAAAWLVAAEKIADFTGTSDDFAGWLFGVARNLSLNSRRRAARRAESDAGRPLPPAGVAGPEATLAESDWVRRTLAGLPERERDVLTCMEVLELDAAATSEALGMSAVAVRVTRHRGLKRLRGRLEAQSSETNASSTSR